MHEKTIQFGVDWREDAAAAWEAQDVQLGVVREVDDDLGQAFLVSGACFRRWMQVAGTEAAVGDVGYTIGRRVLHMMTEESEDPDRGVWGLVRRAMAVVLGKSVFRVAALFLQVVIAVTLSERGVMDLGLPLDQSAQDVLHALRTISADACPLERRRGATGEDCDLASRCGRAPLLRGTVLEATLVESAVVPASGSAEP